jgi:hypothetical protein
VNAAVKLSAIEQAGRDIELANARNDVFEIDRANAREGLLDELEEVLRNMTQTILDNHAACDQAENGKILSNVIGGYAIRVQRKREAEELWDEFVPSWRSQVQP